MKCVQCVYGNMRKNTVFSSWPNLRWNNLRLDVGERLILELWGVGMEMGGDGRTTFIVIVEGTAKVSKNKVFARWKVRTFMQLRVTRMSSLIRACVRHLSCIVDVLVLRVAAYHHHLPCHYSVSQYTPTHTFSLSLCFTYISVSVKLYVFSTQTISD
jgi:hypothetical protein